MKNTSHGYEHLKHLKLIETYTNFVCLHKVSGGSSTLLQENPLFTKQWPLSAQLEEREREKINKLPLLKWKDWVQQVTIQIDRLFSESRNEI